MSQAFHVATLLEIGRKANGEIPESLISAAYRASRSRPVMLVLDAVTPREVDELLDPVVARSGRNHRGVVYASLRDDNGVVLNSAAAAGRVFAASDVFRAKLASRGIAFNDVAEAEQALSSCSEQEDP
jgi:Tfp pilus assembly protein FimT